MATKTHPSLSQDIEAGLSNAGERIDKFLAQALTGLSRVRVQALIHEGQVQLNGKTIGDASQRVKPGDVFRVAVPPPVADTAEGENIALTVVYEDKDLIVIDKPEGLVVHPAAGHATGTLVNALIAHCGASLSGIGGVKRPGIVHRLDKDTSGLLVVAKTDAAHQGLSDQFKSHGLDGRLTRSYLALAWGTFVQPSGTIDAALARSVTNRTKIAVTRKAFGRHAVTHYKVERVFPGAATAGTVSLVRLQLETGRTHQIRVHLAHTGHPVLGDPVYGTGFKTRIAGLTESAQLALSALNRQALHAQSLGFEHPTTGEPMHFESPLPADFAQLLAALEGKTAKSKAAASKRAQRKS